MGRPSLGKAAKDVVVATKVTIAERDALVDRYGNVYRGVKHGVSLALADGKGPRGLQVQGAYIDEATQMPADDDAMTLTKHHRHRRGEKQESTYEQGQEVKHYLCAEEGCEAIL